MFRLNMHVCRTSAPRLNLQANEAIRYQCLHLDVEPERLEQGICASDHLCRSLSGAFSKNGIQDSLRPRGQSCSGTMFGLGLEQVRAGLRCLKHGLWQTSKPGAPNAERRFRQTAGEAVQEGDLCAAV